MPIYDYKCKACDHEFEKNVKIANMTDPQECPECKGETERVIRGAPSMGDPVRLGLIRPDNGFRDVLRKIHATTPGSCLNNNSSYI